MTTHFCTAKEKLNPPMTASDGSTVIADAGEIVERGGVWLLDDGENLATRIEFCPYCGIRLALPQVNDVH